MFTVVFIISELEADIMVFVRLLSLMDYEQLLFIHVELQMRFI